MAVSCAEPDTAGLAARIRDRDGEVWTDDCVETHVSGDSRVGDHQFIVNPAGTLYDARDRDAAWNSTARVVAAVADGRAVPAPEQKIKKDGGTSNELFRFYKQEKSIYQIILNPFIVQAHHWRVDIVLAGQLNSKFGRSFTQGLSVDFESA